MTLRIYKVTDSVEKNERLVKAGSPAEAIRIIIGDRYEATKAKAEDVLKVIQNGGQVLSRPE